MQHRLRRGNISSSVSLEMQNKRKAILFAPEDGCMGIHTWWPILEAKGQYHNNYLDDCAY